MFTEVVDSGIMRNARVSSKLGKARICITRKVKASIVRDDRV